MFIVTINSLDRSSHTLLVDAQVQLARFEALGETNVAIVEKDSYNPPQED